MIVVSDASPVLALSRLGQLSLLPGVYGEILVPATVAAEIRRGFAFDGSDTQLDSLPWLEVREDPPPYPKFNARVDDGEAAAIRLAIVEAAGLLLVDDRAGYAEAKLYGVTPVGTLGVLLEAKRQGLIQSVRPFTDRLLADEDFWLAPSVVAYVLGLAGEAES